jgi:hypothetical protein
MVFAALHCKKVVIAHACRNAIDNHSGNVRRSAIANIFIRERPRILFRVRSASTHAWRCCRNWRRGCRTGQLLRCGQTSIRRGRNDCDSEKQQKSHMLYNAPARYHCFPPNITEIAPRRASSTVLNPSEHPGSTVRRASRGERFTFYSVSLIGRRYPASVK